MKAKELSALLFATGEQIKERIHSPRGGYSDGNQLGDALELQNAAKLVLLYARDVDIASQKAEVIE